MIENFVKGISFGIAMVLLLGGCQSLANIQKTDDLIEIKVNSKEEQMETVGNYTIDDYRKIFKDIVQEADTYKTEAELLSRWIIRTLGQEKLYFKTDLTKEQVRLLANQQMKRDKAWKAHAKKKYSITLTDEEIDRYIENGPDKSDIPKQLAFAEALGMTLKEYNHNFDRDLYEKNVIWNKLRPLLKEKYDTKNNNTLVEKYEEEYSENLEQNFNFIQ